MKTYDKYKELIKNYNLEKNEINTSNIYKYIVTNAEFFNIDIRNIIFSNITTMALENDPKRLRIRNDKFLELALKKENSIIIAGVQFNNKLQILVFWNKFFWNYQNSTSSSNSIFNFTIDELENGFVYNEEDTIIFKGTKSNKGTKYAFYATNDKNFNSKKFKNFYLKTIKNDVMENKNESSVFFNKNAPNIPNETKKHIREFYNHSCINVSSATTYKCPCGNGIDIDFLKNNDLTYVHLHHIVPKEYFFNTIKNNEYLKWEVVHDPINLIPLCLPCHTTIHKKIKKEKNLSKEMFDSIVGVYKDKNILLDFEKYVIKHTEYKDIQTLYNTLYQKQENINE